MQRPPYPSPHALPPDAGKVAQTPWDYHHPPVTSPPPFEVAVPATADGAIDLAPQLAQHRSYFFKPRNEYQFVGAMWNRTESETHVPGIKRPAFLQRWLTIKTEEGYYYPKYPFGISVLDAVAMRVGGVFQSRATAPPYQRDGREWAFLVSPVSTTLAVLAIYFLARIVVSPFYAVL